MNTESHPGAIWNKGRRLKPLGTFEARERQSRRDLRKSMRQTWAEMQADAARSMRHVLNQPMRILAAPNLENN